MSCKVKQYIAYFYKYVLLICAVIGAGWYVENLSFEKGDFSTYL